MRESARSFRNLGRFHSLVRLRLIGIATAVLLRLLSLLRWLRLRPSQNLGQTALQSARFNRPIDPEHLDRRLCGPRSVIERLDQLTDILQQALLRRHDDRVGDLVDTQ